MNCVLDRIRYRDKYCVYVLFQLENSEIIHGDTFQFNFRPNDEELQKAVCNWYPTAQNIVIQDEYIDQDIYSI